LGKDKTLQFDRGSAETAMNVTPGVSRDAWDKWTSDRDTQAQLAYSDQAVAGHGSMYGWSDLDAYGEWGFFPGFGYGWSPFAAAGWSPYDMGLWSFYPGMGYTWISGEPWGWLPYHYGNWNFSPGFGWFWMPGTMGAFSPALVSWYSGPGWIGWAPLGAVGYPGQSLITTASGAVVQNGLAVSAQNIAHAPLSAGTRMKSVSFEPGAGALLSGPLLTANAESLFSARPGGTHIMAPDSVLMGGSADKEALAQAGHAAHQPLRFRAGTTLGGTYTLHGGVGEFRGESFAGAKAENGFDLSHNAGMPGAMILPHGRQVSMSAPPNGNPPVQNWQTGANASSPSMPMSNSSSEVHAASSTSTHH
jgi:hypothetical protein